MFLYLNLYNSNNVDILINRFVKLKYIFFIMWVFNILFFYIPVVNLFYFTIY